MKNVTQKIIGGLALIGIGVTGYRAYKLKKMNDEAERKNVIEIEVETKEDSRK